MNVTPAIAARSYHTYNNLLETIGNTPIVRVNNILPDELKAKDIKLFAKLEYFNPLSSVKDRMALGIIEEAERSGKLKPGMTVVEATSGNAGIATALICANKGYPCVIVMAELYSVERRKIMRMLGARVVLTPAAEKGTGMVKKARELAETHGWFWAGQFENEANTNYHAKTTGPEILQAFSSTPLDYFVSGYGSGGTFSGVGRVLRKGSPNTTLVLSEPAESALLTSGIPQERFDDGSPYEVHPAFNLHPVQGWAPSFIPKLTEQGAKEKLYDELKLIDPEKGMEVSRLMARKEGIFTGISGGCTMAVALDVAKEAPAGSSILAMIPDTAERYLSTPLFSHIQEDMNDEEIEISKSTPMCQL